MIIIYVITGNLLVNYWHLLLFTGIYYCYYYSSFLIVDLNTPAEIYLSLKNMTLQSLFKHPRDTYLTMVNRRALIPVRFVLNQEHIVALKLIVKVLTAMHARQATLHQMRGAFPDYSTEQNFRTIYYDVAFNESEHLIDPAIDELIKIAQLLEYQFD